MAFSDTQSAFSQEHFTIVEIDLPVVNGTCTIGSEDGFGTPLTCDQEINGTFTHKFTFKSSPQLPVSGVWRCIDSISETPTELQSGRGLASRGNLSIRFSDFKGDPNPLAQGVTDEVKAQGTFFGKMDARNIMINRDIRIKNYRIVNGVMPDLDNDAEVRHYIVESFSNDGVKWNIKAKDELSRVNIDEQVWPPVTGDFLRLDIGQTDIDIPVNDSSFYSVNSVIRIGEELMTVLNIIDSQNIRVRNRGSVVGVPQFTNNISRVESTDAKDAGDEVFLCKIYDGANIADVLSEILTDSGVDPSFIPIDDWYTEIAEWHNSTEVITLFTEPEDVNDVITQMLESYMLDMWFDPVAREIKLSAISVWKQSSDRLTENKQIDYDSVKRREVDSLRATNATIVYDKPFKSKDNDTENFRKASFYSNPILASESYYSESKEKQFDNNPIIDRTAGDLLVQRYVSRYGIAPQRYTWKTQEKYLTFNTGDVVDIETSVKQSFTGLNSSVQRAQIISIKPNYTQYGRDYTVNALTYEPAFDSGTEIVITGNVNDIDLYNQYAGAPNIPVELTFIFDGVKSGSSNPTTPSIRLGNFPEGSKVIIILANGADLQAAGGMGGDAGGAFFEPEVGTFQTAPTVGKNGGTVIDCTGVDCDIYFSGATPSSTYATADGYIRAPAGGGGATPATSTRAGDSGGGGAGRVGGLGGRNDPLLNELPAGEQGESGSDNGSGGAGGGNAADGGDWGQAGGNATSLGGAAGKGIVDSGATVVLFGEDSNRYINGNGDH